MTAPKGIEGDDGTARIRGDIERTRGEMSRTVNEIEERLSPAHIKEQLNSVTASVMGDIEHKVAELKESVIGGYHEAKDHLKDDLGREIRGARHMVSDEITHARAAVREATVGRVEHMVHDARESVTDAGSSVLDTIKANPIPAALIGVGLGWLIFSARRSSGSSSARRISGQRLDAGYAYGGGYSAAEGRHESEFAEGPRRALRQGQRAVGTAAHAASEGVSNLGHRVQEGASHLVEGAEGAAHDVGNTVSHYAHDARDAAMHFADDARVRGGRVVRGAGRQLMRAERGVESTLRENPLAMGAVAIAIGAAIGLALPHTHVEDEWMGESKERFIHQAEGVAGEAIHKAEAAVAQLTSGDDSKDKQKKGPATHNNGLASSDKSSNA